MNEKQAIELLKKYSNGDEKIFKLVLDHSKAVQKVALDLAKDIPGIDIELIKIGSLLHDIGRFGFPIHGPETIKHGIRGAKILRKENQEKLARIAETHIGAGIGKDDIEEQNLPLPKRDFMPTTKEEKIITCADNMVFKHKESEAYNRIGTIDESIERFSKRFGPEHGKRTKDLYDEIINMKKK